MVANLLTDASSNTKYWYFIRIMGKEMGFSLMEVALKTRPNVILIGE
jgi:6-phosphofructokinase